MHSLDALIGIKQPYGSRNWGFRGLQAYYLYLGRYRKALEIADHYIEWSVQNNNAGLAANIYLRKSVVMMLGCRDKEAARRQLEATGRLEYTTLELAVYAHILAGDYEGAEKVATGGYYDGDNIGYLGYNHNAMKTLLHIQNGECDKAMATADRVLNQREIRNRFSILYPLSFCYLEKEQPEKAIANLRWTQFMRGYYIPRIGLRPFYYPKSFYGLGRVYEQQGDTLRAIENY